MPTPDESKVLLGAYHFLVNQINLDHDDIDIPEEQQLHSYEAAAYDFDSHNSVVNFDAQSVDLIKCVSFVGCHLLTWLPDLASRRQVIRSLMKCLDSLAQAYRDDDKSLSPDHMIHIERLVWIEAQTVHSKEIMNDIWGHGFWRVGLYMSFLSAAKGGSII